jgi:hypothetical protein
MEHRWGTRQTLDVAVQLHIGSGLPVSGRMLNASSSGAYVATSATLPIMTRVHVVLGSARQQHGRSHRVAAYIVRTDGDGIGIEWQEFAPSAVLALMDALELLPSRASFAAAAIHRAMEARRECQYIPLPHSNIMSCRYYHTCATRGALQ